MIKKKNVQRFCRLPTLIEFETYLVKPGIDNVVPGHRVLYGRVTIRDLKMNQTFQSQSILVQKRRR